MTGERPAQPQARATAESLSHRAAVARRDLRRGCFFGVARQALKDLLVCVVNAVPTIDLDPFALFKVFVVLEEVLNGIQAHRVDI